jgi:hypothetical protein
VWFTPLQSEIHIYMNMEVSENSVGPGNVSTLSNERVSAKLYAQSKGLDSHDSSIGQQTARTITGSAINSSLPRKTRES